MLDVIPKINIYHGVRRWKKQLNEDVEKDFHVSCIECEGDDFVDAQITEDFRGESHGAVSQIHMQPFTRIFNKGLFLLA